MTNVTPGPDRRSRFWLYLPFGLLLGFCLIWTGFWFYGRMKLTEMMDLAIAQAAEQGREIRCPDRSIGGFPFRMELTCSNASFKVTTPEGETSGSLGRLIVNARALDPTAVIAVLQSPLSLKTPAGETTATWNEARLSLRASGMSLGSIDAVINGLTIDAPRTDAAGRRFNATMAKFEGHLRQKPDSASDGRADFDLVAKIEGLNSPSFPLIASAPGLEAELQMTASKVPLQPKGPADVILDGWRDAGGVANILLAKVSNGDISAQTFGTLKLDAARMLEGVQNVAFANLDRVLDGLFLQVPVMLRSLLKNGKAPITLGKGRAALGPIPLATLRPLY